MNDYLNNDRYRLAKIKGWIDEHNPGDLLIPMSVAFEERIAQLSPEEKDEELKKLGTTSVLGKITTAGYASLDVNLLHCEPRAINTDKYFLADTLLHMRT